MVDFYARTIVRKARGFDGITPETSTGYTPEKPGGNATRIYKEADDEVGSFGVRDLGSLEADRPLVVWYRLVGTAAVGDKVEIRSAAAGDTNGGYPTGVLLETKALKTTDIGPFILGPTDRIHPFHDDSAVMEFRVLGFTDALHAGILESCCNGGGGDGEDGCCELSEITVTEPGQLDSWPGLRIVYVTMEESGGDVTLPDLADMDEKAALVVVRRGGEWFRIAVDAGDRQNGELNGAIIVNKDDYAIWLKPGSDTWTASADTRTFSDALPADPGVGLPVQLNPWPSGSVYLVEYTEAKTLIFPPTTDQAKGAWAAFTVAQGGSPTTFRLSDPVEEYLDGVLGNTVTLVNPGDTLLVLPADGDGFRTVHNVRDQGATTILAPAVNAVIAANWRGSRFATASAIGGPAVDITLPDPNVAPVAEVGQELIYSAAVNGCRVIATNALIVGLGVAAAVNATINANVTRVIRWDGSFWRIF